MAMEHKITAIRIQKRNHQRVNIYLDGEYAFGLARIVAAWLEVGQEISDEKIADLRDEDEREVPYQRSLKFLNYRPRSEAEIRQYLQKNGVSEEVIAEVVERLQRAGLVDDLRFAQSWVENRSDLRPRSRRALSFELQQRGINAEVIQQTVDQVDDEELAYQAAQKHARRFRELELQEFRRKMYGFLARRGFNYEVSVAAVAQVWAEIHENTSTDDILSKEEEVDA